MKALIHILLAILILVFASACNNNTSSNKSTENSATENAANAHNSRNALDWFGTYTGVVPCADCEGIETEIVLNQDETFVKKTKYLGKSEDVFESTGNIEWSNDGNAVSLTNSDGSKTTYKVGENQLIMLDTEGNIISGDLANNYILKKAMQMSAMSATAVTTSENIKLTGTNWKLVELMGKPFEKKKSHQKNAFINFSDEGRITAYAGCNSMMGSYEAKEGNRISFAQIASTMMACEDMETERIFTDVLGKADNYAISGKTLSFNKARMAPLARFEATE